MAGAKNHDYHILPPDIWPLIGSISAVTLTSGGVLTMHSLPSTSSTLPLRTELAITFTTVDLSRFAGLAACARCGGRLAMTRKAGAF